MINKADLYRACIPSRFKVFATREVFHHPWRDAACGGRLPVPANMLAARAADCHFLAAMQKPHKSEENAAALCRTGSPLRVGPGNVIFITIRSSKENSLREWLAGIPLG